MLYAVFVAELGELGSELGPPSVLIAVGQPTSMNPSDICPTTVGVSVRRSSCVQAYPEYLSTSTIHFLPIASNKSVPTSFMDVVHVT